MKAVKILVPALMSGIMLALAWLGVSGLILLIAFIPLLYAEERIFQEGKQSGSTTFWFISFITFLAWNAFTTWWIWHATPAGAIAAIVINSLLMSLVWWLSHLVKLRKGRGYGGVFLFFLWISFEYLHHHWDMSWPWLTLGNGLANDIKLVQWFEYTGVFGGSAWILGTNLLLHNLLTGLNEKPIKRNLILSGILIAIVIFPVLFSIIRYHKYDEKTDPVEVVIAQPNVDPYHDKFGGMSHQQQLKRLLTVSDSLGTASTTFFVGPETALHGVWENDPFQHKQIAELNRFLKEKYPNSVFVVGASSFKRYLPGEKLSGTARYSADSTIVYDAFNTACFIEAERPVGFYHKTKLVSGVEKMPFEKYLHFLSRLVVDLGGISGTLGTEEDTMVFTKGRAVIAVPVCYESGYGEYLSGFIKKKANIIFVITNDGWWKNTPGYRQHLSYSRLRAVETRRGIARSANTGISCFINQRGDIVAQTQWWKMTALTGKINLNDSITFYVKHGDYIARISVFMTIMLFLSYVVTVIGNRKL